MGYQDCQDLILALDILAVWPWASWVTARLPGLSVKLEDYGVFFRTVVNIKSCNHLE